MNQYVTGKVIKDLREKNNMTQAALAEKLDVSDKTVSKWETGKGYPDISLLEQLAKELKISISELISGNPSANSNVSANMLKTSFYVCPVCGNIIDCVGEASVCCHGINLMPLHAEDCDESHNLSVEKSDGEYYVHINHEMSKTHYISFIAAIGYDSVQLVKLYPEGKAQAYFRINGVREFVFYCNKDGLYKKELKSPYLGQ